MNISRPLCKQNVMKVYFGPIKRHQSLNMSTLAVKWVDIDAC